MGLSNNDINDTARAGIAACVLSIVCSSLMIASLLLFRKQHRNFRTRLALCLSVSVLLFVTPTFISMCIFLSTSGKKAFADRIPHNYCQFQAFMIQWFMVATDLWTGATALYVYLRVVHQKYLEDYQVFVYLACWGVPLIMAILPFFGVGGGYHVISAWCWIKDPLIRLFFLYLPVWINFTFMAVLYTLVIRHILKINKTVSTNYSNKDEVPSHEMEKQRKRSATNIRVAKKLVSYAIVFVILWIPGTVNRVQNSIAPTSPIRSLTITQAFFAFAAGFFYFIAYGIHNKTVINLCNKKLRRTTSSNSHSNSVSTNVATTSKTEGQSSSYKVESATELQDSHPLSFM